MDPVECSHQGLLAYKDGALEDAIVLFSRGIQLTPPSRPKFASKLLKDRADWERLTVADPGERPAPSYFWTKLRPEGPKKNVFGDHPHSSLMTGAPIISRSGFGTD